MSLGDGEVDDRDQNVDGLEEPVEVEESFSARLTAVSSGRRVEDVSQRTESTRTYANPDGTWTLEDLGEPAYVQGEDGQWQDVDLTLVKRGDGSWGPKVSPTDVTIGGGDVVSVVLDEEESRTATLTWPQDLPEPTVEGSVATFTVSETSDLVVTATPVGATYVLRLNEAPDEDDPVFGFDLLTTGMTVVEDDGALVMEDKKGEAISAPAPVIAWDASVDSGGDPNNVVALDAEVSDGVKTADGTHTRVELSAPQGFLTDPDTVYPVVIDPAISKASSLRDTWVRSGTAAQGSDYKLNVGRTGDIAGEARAYLQWQDELKAAGTEVVKAELKLYQYYAESCSTSVRTNIHPLSSGFTTNTTWADRPGVNTASINPGLYFTQNVGGDGCTGVSNGYVTADVTAIYKGWYDNKFDNYGLVLNVPTAEANNKNFGKRFCSWNELSTHATCNTSSRSPVLSVTYSVKPNTPSAPTFSSTNAAGYSNAASLAVTARGTDPYGDRVKYTIEAVNSSNTVSKSCTTALVASNTAASCNLTGLADGTYKLRAKTTDEFGHVSGYSGTTTLIYDRTVPVKPTITASAYAASGLWLEQKPASNAFTMRASNAEVQRFEYQQDNGTVVSVAVSGATPTATVNWNPAGSHTLKVVAVDKANNKSDATIFTFGNGPASITSPTNAGVKTTASHVVKASAPAVTGSTITAKVQWRAYGTGQMTWKDADGSAPTVVVSGATATATGSFNAAAAVKDVNGEDRSRKHTVLDVRVCFVYASGSSTSTSCTWTSDPKSHATLTYVPHAFGSNFPVADAGPGQVAQWTGEFNTSTTDISVPGYLGELTVSRSFSTFNNQQDGPFGKGWKPSFDGVDAGVAGFEIVDDTTYNGTILLVDEEENALIYSQGASKVAQKVGTYTAVDDETAQVGARLEIKTVSNVKKLVFTEDDGTVTTWTHAGAGVWKPESVQVAGDPSTTQFVHDGQGRLKQIIAPQPVGVTCAPPSFVPGCRVLTLEYGTTAGEKKVQSVAYTAYDQSSTLPTKMETHTVAQYTYNNDGYLIEVKDPRSNLSTSYTYAPGSIPNVRRLTSVTPSGLEGYTIEYKDGAPTALFTDGVTAVKRGSTYTGAFTYDLSVSDSKLPRMEKADVSKWGQETPPTKVFAAFGQDSAGAARSSVTADLLKKADITYTDDEGRVINTASYSGGGGGGDTARWLFTATGYDSVGNVIRQLDERGIDQILAIRSAGGTANSDEYATITRYNPEIITASAVTWGSGDGVTTIPAGTVVTPAATLVTDVWEPVREIVDGDGQVTLARQHTATTYDQGAPNQGINPETGLPFRLATTTRVTLAQPGSASSDPSVALPTDEPVLTEQRMGYDPVDGASVTGKTSGWMIGAPTTLTTENGDQDITVKTVFDEQGRTVKEIGADSNGSDAGTTITHYYDARTTANGAPAGLPSQCVNKPAWAGFVCQIVSGEATPSIPVETVTQYSYYMAAAITTESLDGVTRTATTTFDTAGRVEKATTAVTGLTGSTPQPTAKNVYDPATGLQVETQTLGSGDSVTAAVKTQHDSWGRVVKYTDEHGQATTITYDSAGRVSQETSPKFGNTTYTYDPYSGSVIGKQIAGVGEFTAHYSAFGDIVSQTLPTGVVQASSYDRSGQETALTYTVTGDDGSASFAWMMHHDALGRINQISGPGSDGDRVTRYEFDQAARMTAAYDQIGEACTTREYSFDTVGRRTGQVTKTQSCTDAGAPSTSTKVWAYDKADRILSGANGVGSYVYDALGRQTTLPGVDTPQGESAGDLTVSYYDSDLARSVTQNGVTTTYDLDVMDRRSTSTTTEGSDTSTTTRVYEDTSDNPAWATTVKDGVTETTRYVSSIAGDLSLTFSVEDDFLPTGIVDPQGSVVATTSKQTSPNGGTSVVWSGLSLFDEYGNPVTAKTTDTGVLDYGWLGGKERATDATGLVLMGVRLYNSVTGHFTSVDPVTGGNTTRYTYPQDPINKYDLNGKKQHAQLSDAELLAIAKYQRGQPLSKAERSAYNSGMQKIKKNEKYSGERNKQKRANTKKNSGKKGKGNNGKGGGGGSGGIRTFNTPIGTRFSPGGGGTRNLFR
ncbi:DNRLRE domain-containing protein [Populibacterium corticicola]|uniref:DNRLRE domain-containing protein n=1 Tax=Populibacterium corticicola TaxID=1812826 RepID=A0ABW5XGI1_9MICO